MRGSHYPLPVCPHSLLADLLPDDIEEYFGSSLKRHEGCDLIDLFPGAGLWSTKLHDMIKPRRHILMEPDAALYAPFLKNLTSRPGTTLIPKSGLLWTELNAALDSLPDQKARDPKSEDRPERNDTLLVTANLSLYPKTRMTSLYLFQLITAVRTGSIFQRYGLVRMLIWARPQDVHPTVLPIAVQQRGRAAMEAELACEWIHPIAGSDVHDPDVQSSIFRSKRSGGPRDDALELYSAYRVLKRMEEQGIEMPAGRETELIKMAKEVKGGEKALRERMLRPAMTNVYSAEVGELKEGFARGEFDKKSEEYARMKALVYRERNAAKEAAQFGELLQECDRIARMHAEGADKEEIRAAEHEWNDSVAALAPHPEIHFRMLKDNLHLVRQEAPPMLWDRRALEPLVVGAQEFYPNIPCSLLDVQPKAPDPLMTRHKEGSRVFELLLKVMLRNSKTPVSERLDDVFTDTSEGILHNCPSLTDPRRGGSMVAGNGAVCVRTMTEGQWGEIVRAWLGWHFRPSVDALARQHDEEEEDEDDDGTGASGSNELSL